jgi:hypothetical protein
MAALTAKRRSELEARLARLAAARAALTAAAAAASGGGEGSGSSAAPPRAVSDAEWAAKFEAVRGRLGAFRAAKAELAALEAEAGVLAHTLASLGAPVGSGSG